MAEKSSTLTPWAPEDSGHSRRPVRPLFLGSMPHVAERIFQDLSARDLSACALVCSNWNEVARTERLQRTQLGTLKLFFKRILDNPSTALEPAILRWHFDASLRKHLETRFHPGICLAFASEYYPESHITMQSLLNETDFIHLLEPEDRRSLVSLRKHTYLINNVLKPCVPRNCNTMLTLMSGRLGFNYLNQHIFAPLDPVLTGFLLPEIPGLIVERYPLRPDVHSSIAKTSRLYPLRCVLLFPHLSETPHLGRLLSLCLDFSHRRLAVGGSVTSVRDTPGSMIAFYGPNAEAASAVITSEDDKDSTRAKVQSLSTLCDSGSHLCFAFIFAHSFCVSLNLQYSRLPFNKAYFMLHELYPHIPVLLFYENGEVGIDCKPMTELEPNYPNISKEDRCRMPSDVYEQPILDRMADNSDYIHIDSNVLVVVGVQR